MNITDLLTTMRMVDVQQKARYVVIFHRMKLQEYQKSAKQEVINIKKQMEECFV